MRSDMEWLALVGPLERLGHGAIEVGDEVQHLVAEIVNGSKVASSQQLADQNTQPEFDLIQPGRVLRRVMEDNVVRRVCQERSPCRHRFQNAAVRVQKLAGTTAGPER